MAKRLTSTRDNTGRGRLRSRFEKVRTGLPRLSLRLCVMLFTATLPKRDPVDTRIINIVRTGKPTYKNGIIDIPSDVGGWPEYKSTPAPTDSDHDGMPDTREQKFSLKWNDPSDGAKDADDDGYTNVEEWLNSTDPTQFVDYRNPENNKNTVSLCME